MAESYYDAIANQYDTLVDTPIRHARNAAIRQLNPNPGDTVLDLGCGSGVNFPYIREQVQSSGAVIGVDVSTGMLSVAIDRIRAAGWENVFAVRGDASALPVANPDAIFASLLVAFFDDPIAVVQQWAEAVGPGGRIGLLDFGRSTQRGRVLNPLFVLFVNAVSPDSSMEYDLESVRAMERANAVAHRALAQICTSVEHTMRFFGFARVTVGTVPSDWDEMPSDFDRLSNDHPQTWP